MRAATIVTLSAFSLLLSANAWAEGTAKPAPAAKKGEPIVVDGGTIKGRVPHVAAVDVSRVVLKAPLPPLRQPLVDRIGAAVEKDPF